MNPNQAPAITQNPGVFERLNNTLRNSRIGQLATGALAALTLGAGAETANLALNATPVAAENVPTQASGSGEAATASTASQECISKLLRPPYNISTTMYSPGSHAENTLIKASYHGVKGCDYLERDARYRQQVKDDGEWKDYEGDFWYPADTHVPDKNAEHRVSMLVFPTRGIQVKRVNGHWEPVRVRFVNYVRNAATHKIVARGKIKDKRIKIDQ